MLATECEVYAPSIDEGGRYVDSIPANYSGLKCPCTNLIKSFKTKPSFAQHCKTQRHCKWLSELNANRQNFYKELMKANEIVKQQQAMLASRDNELTHLRLVVADLRRSQEPVPMGDLLQFD